MKKGLRRNWEEQTAVRELEQRGRPILEDAIQAAETLLKRPWQEILEAHGDGGRDGVLYVLVRHARFRLPELLGQLPGVRYSAAAQAIQRFGKALPRDGDRARFAQRYRRQLAKISNN